MSLSYLNPRQYTAVTHGNGPVMIIAGPGTGKTKTLSARIQYLLTEKKIPPQNIAAFTFTKKAATEMKERISLSSETITTFHAFGYNLIREYSAEPVKVVSQAQQNDIVDELIHSHYFNSALKHIPLRDMIHILSLMKSHHETIPPHSLYNGQNIDHDLLKDVYTAYNAALHHLGVYDFDDLLLQAYYLLKKDKTSADHIRNRFHHILIDEFQDTTMLQYEIVTLLMNQTNLFVIGDPYQSIYSFRGAQSTIFEHMKHDFPDTKEIVLTDNYRSHAPIIQVSACLFPEQRLRAVRTGSGTVSFIRTINEYTEAAWIVKEISKSIGGTHLLESSEYAYDHTERNMRFSDFAVVYRTHHTGRVLEQALAESGIPYQVIGGHTLYDNSVIRFFISMLRYIHTPSDDHLWEILTSRILHLPKKHLRDLKQREGALPDTIQSLPAIHAVGEKIFHLKALSQNRSLSKIVAMIQDTFDLEEKQNIIASPRKKRELYQFYNSLVKFDADIDGLAAYIVHIDTQEQHDFYDETVDKVTLMTMHASKGLEFQNVFILGFEEGIIPSIKKQDDVEHLDEEKRLLYVGLTRARDHVYILCTQTRYKKPAVVSRFHTLMQSAYTEMITDEAIHKYEKRRKKVQEKKAQLTMF